MKWVTVKKHAADTGYSEDALRQKIRRGIFIEGVHYRHSPDGRIQINVEAYNAWVEGKRLELHQEAKAA
jgi:hypothetical protein